MPNTSSIFEMAVAVVTVDCFIQVNSEHRDHPIIRILNIIFMIWFSINTTESGGDDGGK